MKKQLAEDDFGSQQKLNVRQPEVCVDYLSYQFDEMDLAASWRVMTKQKKDVVDGIRLENASWRTWAKQRNNLKTISPQSLNWLKDSDVTWLYGPLHTVIRTEEDPFLKPKTASTAETLGLMVPLKPILKSALKKVTQVDLLRRSATELNTTAVESPAKHTKHRKISISDVNNELRAVSPAILAIHRQPKLRFNHQVEQCIALTDEEREHDVIEEDTEEDLYLSDQDYSSDMMGQLSYPSSYCSESNIPFTPKKSSIRKIAPARLKKSQSDGDTDDVSSISSVSTGSSVGAMTTRSPMVSSPALRAENSLYLDSDSDLEDSKLPIPIPNQIMRSSSTNSINQPYREKSNVAEPALVTTHQTATDLKSTNDTSILNSIANWASTYLWSNNNKK